MQAGVVASEVDKNNRSWFGKAEGRLYAYPALMARHKDLVVKRKETYPLGSQGFGDTVGIRAQGIIGDGAAKWVLKRENMQEQFDKSFEAVLKEFSLMDNFLELCTQEEQEFIELRYFKNWARSSIIREMAISLTTYYRLRDSVIVCAAAVFGYLEYDKYVEMLAQ
jgi:hypothetical protein